MFKKGMLLGMVILLVVGMLFATGAKEQKKTVIRWMWLPEAMGDVENGPFMKALQAKFPDVEFQLEPVLYSAYPDRFPVMIAAGDVPDIFQGHTQYMPQLVEADLIYDLSAALPKYGPDIVGNARDGQLRYGQYGGKQYAVPASYLLKYFSQNIRMDWLEKLGLEVPRTLEEFREVARAFVAGDPNGNGKKDEYATAFRTNVNFIDSFFLAFGVAPNHHQTGMWQVRDGKHTFDWVQPEMKEALMELASWYKEGLIHPESLTFGWNDWWNAYLRDSVGMWYHQPRRLSEMNTALRQAGVENANMWPIAPPIGPKGLSGTANEGQPWATFFGKNGNLELCIEILNYTYTQEFFLACGGRNDVYYPSQRTLNEKGWPQFYSYEEMLADPNYEERRTEVLYSMLYTGWCIENPNMTNTWPDRELAEYVKKQFKNTLSPAQIVGNELADTYAVTSSKPVPVPADAKYFTRLQDKFREIASRIVSGRGNPDDTWNEWLDYYAKNGGPEIEKEVNELFPL